MHRVLLTGLLTLPAACSSAPTSAEPPESFEVTIDSLVWSEDILGTDHPGLLGHLREWGPSPTLHRFTGRADKLFHLRSGDHEVVARTGTGGVTSGKHGRFIILRMGRGLLPDRSYTLQPRNENDDYRWRVAEGVSITR